MDEHSSRLPFHTCRFEQGPQRHSLLELVRRQGLSPDKSPISGGRPQISSHDFRKPRYRLQYRIGHLVRDISTAKQSVDAMCRYAAPYHCLRAHRASDLKRRVETELARCETTLHPGAESSREVPSRFVSTQVHWYCMGNIAA